MRPTVIHLHPLAPAKPIVGKPCNGCGVCCAFAPCPLGMLVSGRRRGACAALRWQADAQRYDCAVASDPGSVWPRLPLALQAPLMQLARRWIAAGAGCDSDLEAEVAAPVPGPG
jgi:hypothetical protein